jgi:predicted aspartyl protease
MVRHASKLSVPACLLAVLAVDSSPRVSATGPESPHVRYVSQSSARLVRFESPRGHLIGVRAAVGARSRVLLLDTGTYRTVIDRRVIQELGLRGTADRLEVFGVEVPAERVVLPALRVGPLQVTELPVLAADLSSVTQRLGWHLDGILGLDVLRGHCLIVDYTARTLGFDCSGSWTASLRCDPASPYVVASATVDGRDHRLLVDSGSDAIALFERVAAPHLEGRPLSEVEAETLVETVRLRRFVAGTVRLGATILDRQPIEVVPSGDDDPGYDGVLGVRRLSSRVQLDLKGMVISWDR